MDAPVVNARIFTSLDERRASQFEQDVEPITSPEESRQPSTVPSNDTLMYPTEEELQTLRRVRGKIPWAAYTVGFVEMCERFS